MSALLSSQPEWADVRPMAMPEGSRAVVDIAASAEYQDTFGLLYACIERSERSERVLALTERCIALCSAHYSAWDVRYQCLEALDADMDAEWHLCYTIALSNCKNYQLWNHRRRCAMRMGARNADRELEFAAWALEQDAKNYHVWSHRQAVVAAFGAWKAEWVFVERMLDADRRNNSAWNQRGWLLTHFLREALQPERRDDDTPAEPTSPRAAASGRRSQRLEASTHAAAELLDGEVAFIEEHVTVAPHNESAWNYLFGLPVVLSHALAALCVPPVEGSFLEEDTCERGADTWLGTRTASGLALLGRAGEERLAASVAGLSSAAQRISLAAVQQWPACTPARVALLRAHMHEAAHNSNSAARHAACQNVQRLAQALQAMDPVHRQFYRAASCMCPPSDV